MQLEKTLMDLHRRLEKEGKTKPTTPFKIMIEAISHCLIGQGKCYIPDVGTIVAKCTPTYKTNLTVMRWSNTFEFIPSDKFIQTLRKHCAR